MDDGEIGCFFVDVGDEYYFFMGECGFVVKSSGDGFVLKIYFFEFNGFGDIG